MRVGSALLTLEPDFLVQEGQRCGVEHAHATFTSRLLASGVEAHVYPPSFVYLKPQSDVLGQDRNSKSATAACV